MKFYDVLERNYMKSELDINKKTGERVRTCIYENFKNQSEFARVTGFSTANIACICNGQRKLTTDNARAFAKLFGVRMEYLLGEDDFKTEEDVEAYNKKLYAEPFTTMDEHERSITARQLVLYDMVLPWLLQLYDVDDNADQLTQKEYFKFAEYLDHELQHIIQSYFNVRSGEFVNPINTKSDAELFERYTRDCLEELRKILSGAEFDYLASTAKFLFFETQHAFSYSSPYDNESIFHISKDLNLERFDDALHWFNIAREFYYDDSGKASSASVYFRERAIDRLLEFVKPEYRTEIEQVVQDLFYSNDPKDINYLTFDLSDVIDWFAELYKTGCLVDSDDPKEMGLAFIDVFEKLSHIKFEAMENGNSNKTR